MKTVSEERAIRVFLRAIENSYEGFWAVWHNAVEAGRENEALMPKLNTITVMNGQLMPYSCHVMHQSSLMHGTSCTSEE